MNDDYISRSALISDIRAYADRKHCNGEIEIANGILKSIPRIKEAPAIDTERRELWGNDPYSGDFVCTGCGYTTALMDDGTYCQHCGAKMGGGTE